MKRIVPVVLAAALAVALAGQASAQPDGPRMDRRSDRMQAREQRMNGGECRRGDGATSFAPRIHRREIRQVMRIRRGELSGRITPGEGRWLRMHERHIRALELRARRDGDFSLRERARVHRALDRQSWRIRRMGWNGRAI